MLGIVVMRTYDSGPRCWNCIDISFLAATKVDDCVYYCDWRWGMKRLRTLVLVVFLVILVAIPVAAAFDGGGSNGWLLPQATLCAFDGGGSNG